jgi:hypothetical protein
LWTRKKSVASPNELEAARIDRLLDRAIEQRSKLTLIFSEGVTAMSGIEAFVVRHDAAGVVLRVSLVNVEPEKFAGTRLKCSFRISDSERPNQKKLLAFESHVVSVQITKDGDVLFEVAPPAEILNAQQRRCVRVNVDRHRISLLSVWPELPTGTRISGNRPLAISRNDDSGPILICNISTIGLCLRVKGAELRKTFSETEDGGGFTFYFEASREDGEGEQSFWLNAVLRNQLPVSVAGEVLLGFEFIAEGVIDDFGQLQWESLWSGEVSDLGPFIFRWNLADFQKEKHVSV